MTALDAREDGHDTYFEVSFKGLHKGKTIMSTFVLCHGGWAGEPGKNTETSVALKPTSRDCGHKSIDAGKVHVGMRRGRVPTNGNCRCQLIQHENTEPRHPAVDIDNVKRRSSPGVPLLIKVWISALKVSQR